MVNSCKEVTKHTNMEPEGQLSENERFFLENLVIEKKPRKILESGTWKGFELLQVVDGSTGLAILIKK